MPNSRFALHGFSPSLIHGLCTFFASNSRFMCLFQAALDTRPRQPLLRHPLSSRFCTSRFARLRLSQRPIFGKIANGGVFRKGGCSNNRFVLIPDVAIASEVSILSKNSLAITDFHLKKTQHVRLFEKPPFLEPPPIRNALTFGAFQVCFGTRLGASDCLEIQSVCAPLCCRSLCCVSLFCTVGGGVVGSRSTGGVVGSRSKQLSKGPAAGGIRRASSQ